MPTTNAFAEIGSLVGDPGRANMLVALMDGRALTATELAATAGITPQTASSHFGQLVGANLLTVERQGRHRYHRLADPAIARMIEGMMAVATNSTVGGRPATRTGPNHIAMRQARTCYDHLAGRIAVAIADSMVAQGEVELSPDGGILTPLGAALLARIGIDLNDAAGKGSRKRVFCRPCLDWSERRPHIAGMVGASLLKHMLASKWVQTTSGARTVTVTPMGQRALGVHFDFDPSLWNPSLTA